MMETARGGPGPLIGNEEASETRMEEAYRLASKAALNRSFDELGRVLATDNGARARLPTLDAPLLEKPSLDLLEIATRLAVAVAPSVWRLGIPKERLAQECVDLAAHILQAKRQPIIHEPTGEDIGEVVIGNDGTFWCTPFVDGMLPTTSGPHHSAAAAIKHVRTAYEAHRNALAGCK